MNILVINSGSSSIKYQLYRTDGTNFEVATRGVIEKIGEKTSRIIHQMNGEELPKFETQIPNHKIGFASLEGLLTGSHEIVRGRQRVIQTMQEIDGIGHRVVHGGTQYATSIKIDDDVKKAIRDLFDLAPLHNPPNLLGIEECERYGLPQVAVFDTSFHQTMEPWAYKYAISPEFRMVVDKGGGVKETIIKPVSSLVRRYGFHGTSHRYVWEKISEAIGGKGKVISIHLGNGCSMAAIHDGKVIDTTMGLTPLEGLVMGTRGGDIDPGVVLYLMDHWEVPASRINEFLNKQAGLLGLSGISNDLRDVYKEADSGNERAKEALKMYAYRVTKYIGAYMAALGGADAIAFTAGGGANSDRMRAQILQGMEWAGIVLDPNLNKLRCGEDPVLISKGPIRVYMLQTNEELIIARDTYNLLKRTA